MEKYNGDKEKSLNKLYEIMFRCFKRIQFKIKCVINAGGRVGCLLQKYNRLSGGEPRNLGCENKILANGEH